MPQEATEIHTRLLKCALATDESRAYWRHVGQPDPSLRAVTAFEEYWFGAKSMAWVEVLLANMRARYDAFPEALALLHRWRSMPRETRLVVCHVHLQLTDPMYRAFTGDYLVDRHNGLRADVRRDGVIQWVADQGPGRWTMATRKQLASKLLSAAHAAGLVKGKRDPRELSYPRVTDEALGYIVQLLRGVRFEGTLLDNPYLRSLGLTGALLDARLEALPGLAYRRLGDVVEFGFREADLQEWAARHLPLEHSGGCS